ncbi:MAG: DNA/RNA non-specific endonuclease, partial [Pseudomonadota bacterium]
MSAAMVDSSDAMKRPGNRPPGDYSRDGLAGRSSDAWFEDDRIAEGAQLPDRFFTNDRKAFDRGHVVRRDDVAWGTTYDEMRNANGDSFHSTNCSPQVSTFNQSSRGTDNWGDLENL